MQLIPYFCSSQVLNNMKALVSFLFLGLVIFSCSSKDDDVVTGAQAPAIDNDFTSQFPVIKLRYALSDTTLDRMTPGEKPLKLTANKYFPESLIRDYFDNGGKIDYYPMGKVQNGDQEIYVIMKAVSGFQRAAYILVYDNKLNYKDGSMICQTDGNPATSYYASLDRFFNITIRRTDYIKNAEPVLNEIFLAYNNSGKLGQVVTNGTAGEVDFINPIDTLPATKKYTGDYFMDDNNIVSFRDAPDSGRLMMFFTYQKTKETCEGEIKDFVKMVDGSKAVYQRDGDPCTIEFIFSGNSVTVKEGTDCGNKKGAFDCTLNGTFTKRIKKAKVEASNEVINPLGAKPPTQAPANTVDPNAPKPKPVQKGIPAAPEAAAAQEAAAKNPDQAVQNNPDETAPVGDGTTAPATQPAAQNPTPTTGTTPKPADPKPATKPKVEQPKKPTTTPAKPGEKKPVKQSGIQ